MKWVTLYDRYLAFHLPLIKNPENEWVHLFCYYNMFGIIGTDLSIIHTRMDQYQLYQTLK